MLLDVGSLSLLLWKLGAAWYAAVAIGAGVGGLTTYEAQWRWLLSRRAYRRSARAGRYVAVALFVLVANAGGAWLVAGGRFYGYLFVRVATAVLVGVAWWQDRWARPEAAAAPRG
jgi:hypothetical protein